ncbi:unnamed protein product [Ectocarpus fasciculatus]
MFQNGGLAASMVSLLCAAWVACDNMIVLIRVAEKTGKNSYGQVNGNVKSLNWGMPSSERWGSCWWTCPWCCPSCPFAPATSSSSCSTSPVPCLSRPPGLGWSTSSLPTPSSRCSCWCTSQWRG